MGNLKKHKDYHKLLNQFELGVQDNLLDLPLKHIFAQGMYIREMFIPQGVCLTSKVHLHENVFIVSMGVINIIDENCEITTMIAPFTGVSKKGTRRMGYALSDTIFSSIHPNPDNCTDIPTLEKRLFKSYNNPLLKGTKKQEIA